MKIKISVITLFCAFIICACNVNAIRENPANTRYNNIFTTIELNDSVNFKRKKIALIIGVDSKFGTVPTESAFSDMIESSARSAVHMTESTVHSIRSSFTNNRNERARQAGQAMASAIAGIAQAARASEIKRQLKEHQKVLDIFSNVCANVAVKNQFIHLINSNIRRSLNNHNSMRFTPNHRNIDDFTVSTEEQIISGVFANYHKLKAKRIDYVMQIMLKVTYVHTPLEKARLIYQLSGVLVNLKKLATQEAATRERNSRLTFENTLQGNGKDTPGQEQQTQSSNKQNQGLTENQTPNAIIWRNLVQADVTLKTNTRYGYRPVNYKHILSGRNPLIHNITNTVTIDLLRRLTKNFKKRASFRKIIFDLRNYTSTVYPF